MEEKQAAKKPHDAFFRWLFADVNRLRYLLELAGKINIDVGEFLAAVNLDTLVRIPDSYSEVYETGDADLAFRVNVLTGAPVFVGILVEHKSGRDANMFNQVARYMRSVMSVPGPVFTKPPASQPHLPSSVRSCCASMTVDSSFVVVFVMVPRQRPPSCPS